ncbi:MAG: copper transport protein [Vezdaea aestivalis]|nr:MAG: copper transport protein [Vezdaea aestivalis]
MNPPYARPPQRNDRTEEIISGIMRSDESLPGPAFHNITEHNYHNALLIFMDHLQLQERATTDERLLSSRLFAKDLVRRTRRDILLRQRLGESPSCWVALCEVLRLGTVKILLPSLEWEPLLDRHSSLLEIDIEGLCSILMVTRNILSAGTKAQSLALDKQIGPIITGVIDVAIRGARTLRPDDYLPDFISERDGPTEKSMLKILRISLQLLHHLLHNNEHSRQFFWEMWLNGPVIETTHQPSHLTEDSGLADANHNSPQELAPLILTRSKGGLLAEIPPLSSPDIHEPLLMIVMNMISSSDSAIEHPTDYSPNAGVLHESTQVCGQGKSRLGMLLETNRGHRLLQRLLEHCIPSLDRVEDLRYQLMVRIVRPMLDTSLVSIAYQSIRDGNCFISQAQCRLLRVVLSIYEEPHNQRKVNTKSKASPQIAQLESKNLSLLHFISSHFSQVVIPGVKALLRVQQAANEIPDPALKKPISSTASLENVKECVDIFLQFFILFCGHTQSKEMLIESTLMRDLVSLITELDQHISKVPFFSTQPSNFEVIEPVRPSSILDLSEDTHQASPSTTHFSKSGHSTYSQDAGVVTYKWPSLKRNAIEVLSHLVIKSRKAQDDMRRHGGIDALLNAMAYDGVNPHIKESAIICLKFTLQDNPDNQSLVADLQKVTEMGIWKGA